MKRPRRDIPRSYQSMRDSRRPEKIPKYLNQKLPKLSKWEREEILMQSMHFKRPKNSTSNSHYTSSNPSFEAHYANLNNSDFIHSQKYSNLNKQNASSFMRDSNFQRINKFHERQTIDNTDFIRKSDFKFKKSGNEFYKKRGSNLDKMKKEFKRFETELGKAKKIQHGKKQSNFNNSRNNKNVINEKLLSNIFDKTRKQKKKKKELQIMGNIRKIRRGKSRPREARERSKFLMINESFKNDERVKLKNKKIRTAKTMDKRRYKREFIQDDNEYLFSNRNIQKFPKLKKETPIESQNYKKNEGKKYNTRRNKDI